MKKVLLFLGLLASPAFAQVGVGTNVPKAALDVTATTDGLLMPRVALVNTTTATVITPTISELVYNTATAGDVTPGFYYWDGGKWVRFLLSTTTSNSWALLGNSGTVAGTNFLGTTDNQDLIFKRNNVQSGKISSTNVSLGVNALSPSSPRNRNTAIGAEAMYLNTNGDDNTAIGYQALRTGLNGVRNVAIGNNVLMANTSGGDNTAIGMEALRSNTTGFNNTAVGRYSQLGNTTGYNNTSIGLQSLMGNTTGYSNTAIGSYSLSGVTTGINNLGIGNNAQVPNATGNNQLSIGNIIYGTGVTGTVGAGDIGIGTNAPGHKLDVSGGNLRVSGEIISTMSSGLGQFRATQGNYGAIIRNDGTNTYMPLLTASGDPYGGWNTFRPIRINNATGDLYFQNSQNYFRESDGFVGIGNQSPNTKLDLRGIKSHNAGSGTGGPNDNPSQAIIPGSFDGGSYFNDWPSSWGGGLATWDIVGASSFMYNYYTRSDKRLKNNIKAMDGKLTSDFMKLRPVTYLLNKQTPETEGLQYGFIAQEVAEIFPSIVTKDSGLPDAIIGMNYQALIAPTIQVVQEQQKQIIELQKLIKELQAEVNSLKNK